MSLKDYLKELKEVSEDNRTQNDIMRRLEKISDKPVPCLYPEHNFPSHIVLEPGTYKYTCPNCRQSTIVRVPLVWC